jgi:hypothetical protein
VAKKLPPPAVLNLGGRMYDLVVLRVQSRYEDGTPEDVTVLKNDMTVELSTDQARNEFVTAYLPRSTLRPE